MNKAELERAIIEAIKETQCEEYGNYSFVGGIKNAISEVMFGKSVWGMKVYVFGKGKHAESSYIPQLITDEQLAKVEAIYAGMMKQGFFKTSKNPKMVKLIKEV